MKIETTPSAVIHFSFADVVVDDFWRLKNRLHVESPFFSARLEYWEEVENLFDFLPPSDVTYWRNPPTLELPERAASLAEWSHCIFCGFPLNGTVTLFDCDLIREQGFEWRHVL